MKRCYSCMELYEDTLEHCPYCKESIENQEYHLPVGTILLERFIIGKVLGYGGFGTTYLGWDIVLDKKIAIKEYLPSELSTRFPSNISVTVFTGEKEELFKQGKERFLEEARKLAMFNHEDSIITVYDEFQANNTAYLVMEYYQGQTLASKIEREGIFISEEVKQIMIPLITSLQEVHDKGIIHRDIAPDNIYLTNDNKVKLLDFGAARNTRANKTTSMSVIIKRGYAPEEQYRTNGCIGPWSDVYGICATMYYMLTGVVPMDAIERGNADLIAPIDIVSTILPNLNAAIMNGLLFDYRQRTPDVLTLKKEMLSIRKIKVRHDKEQVKPYHLSSKTKTMGGLTVGILGVLSALLVLGVISTSLINNGSKKILALSQTYVPGILNKETEEAIKISEEADLQMTVIGKLDDGEIVANRVVNQTPAPGTIVAKDSKIKVIVSRGPEYAIVPDVSYQYSEQAKQTLEQAGFEVVLKTEENNEVASGVVFKQSVKENTSCPKKTQIELSVADNSSIDKTKTTSVNISTKTLLEAKKELYNSGLYIAVVERKIESKYKENTVLEVRTPLEDRNPGDIIEVVVSTKKPKKVVPDVEFKNSEEASELLQQIGLKTQLVYEENPDVQPGIIIRQQFKPNHLVESDKIILYVSKGNKEKETAKDKPIVPKDTIDEEQPGVLENPDFEDTVEDTVVDEKQEITKEWSSWTTDDFLKNNKDYQVEEKTQYAYYHVVIQQASTPINIEGYQVVKTTNTGTYTNWSPWSNYISGKAPTNTDTQEYSETENQYRYFQYACNTCGTAGYCFPWPGYLCAICDGECGTYLTRDVWNVSAEQSIKYTLKMQNGLSHPAIHYLGNYNDDWFYIPESYIINQRYKKRTRESIYTYTYRSTTTSKWFENKPDIGEKDELVSRKVYRYKIKE